MATEGVNEQTVSSEKEQGRVKWFNNKAGYGFITATTGQKVGEDIFCHHSSLDTDDEQYKYLVAGEYVEFIWKEMENDGEHKFQAGSVKGVNGGKLMCETRFERRETRPPRSGGNNRVDRRRDSLPGQTGNRRQPVQRYRGGGPKTFRDDEGVEWMLVKKRGDGRRRDENEVGEVH